MVLKGRGDKQKLISLGENTALYGKCMPCGLALALTPEGREMYFMFWRSDLQNDQAIAFRCIIINGKMPREIGSTDQDSANKSNFAFAIRIRQSLPRCLQLNHVELTTRGGWTLFLNENNRAIRVIGDSIPIDDPKGDAGFPNNHRRDRNGRFMF
eukprot:scaffold75760_cov60-Cyclotella_meneghiniana.AAC.6